MHRLFLTAALTMTAIAAHAGNGPLEVTSTAQVEVKQRQADGTTRVALTPAKRVVPGDRVVLTLAYRNTGAKPIDNVVFANPIPAGLAYRAPADGSVAPEVSVDGKTYAPLATLTVRDANGTRAARSDDVTHIRWRLSRPLPPGAQGKFAYAAVLK